MDVDWFLTLETELESKIDGEIRFRTKMNGEVMTVGGFRLLKLGPKRVNKVSKMKVKNYCHDQMAWKIQVILDGKSTKLYLKPIHLLKYARIIFEYLILTDGSRTLCARGLMSSGVLVQLRGLGTVARRKRQYASSERKYGLEDIGKARLEMKGKRYREDKAPTCRTVSHASSNISKNTHDGATDIVNVVVGCAEPAFADERFHCKTLKYHLPSIIGGGKAAEISANDVCLEVKQWEHAIVGHLVGEDSGDHSVECYVREHWKDFGSFHTYQLGRAFFIFVFTNGDDKFKILEQGQWFIHGRPFILKSWIPNMSLDPSVFLATVPVWVRFPQLDLQFWSLTSLSKISSLLGRPLFTDGPTAEKKRLQYARVCVEIKTGDKLPDMVHIFVNNKDSMLCQAVEYEWKPQPCPYCCLLCQASSACALTHKLGALLNEGGDKIDPLLADANEKSHKNCEKVPLQHCPPLWDENDDGDVCHDGNSTTDEDSYDVEVFFDSEDGSDGSSTAVAANCIFEFDSGIIEVPENEEDNSPVSLTMKSERNAATKWLSYFVKLKEDIGLKVRGRFYCWAST